MAYLKNDDNKIVIDAILTKYGKEKLAKSGSLGITKFAVADDEVDYSLYNVNNPQGTDYFNSAIINMPLLEALVDPNISMKYKLFTADAVQTDSPIDVVSELSIKYSSNFKSFKNSLLVDTGNPYVLTPTFNPERSDYTGNYMAELTVESYEQSGIQYSFYQMSDYGTEGVVNRGNTQMSEVLTGRSIMREGKNFGLIIKRFPIKGLKVGVTIRIWAVGTPSNVASVNLTITDINNATYERFSTKKQPLLDPTTGTTGGVTSGGNSTL